jgi:formylglycine-generating enzyme required for sulfatase activity
MALTLSARAGDADEMAGRRGTRVALPSELPGFRPDLWYLPDDSALGFVEIPGGAFTMGSDPAVDRLAFDVERWSARRRQGVVDLPVFRLARTEVTVAQYGAFVNETGHPVVDERALAGPPDHPVTFVSWTDAVAYAGWLDEALRRRVADLPPTLGGLVNDGWRVTLPTEAQWEKAARGDDGRVWPWGMEPRTDRANFRSGATVPVGSFACPECPYPVFDLSGNVWEWTRSPYQPYPYDDSDDGAGLDATAAWVMRGGSFADPAQHVRAANRGARDPGARLAFVGFRVALVR